MSLRDNYTYEEPTAGGFRLLPEGEYDFTIEEVFDWEESKKGNDMLPISILVEGTKQNDWLVFTETAKWRIDGFLKSIFGGALPPGKKVDFENTTWMQGRKGRVRLKVKKIPKKNGLPGEMMEVNEIDAYVYESTKMDGRSITTPKAAPAPVVEEDEDDSIPF
jgi:hypothetical protein